MDPRKVLGVGADATKDDIHRAYREKVSKYHPDMGGDAWAFQQVQQAYEVLLGKEPSEDLQSKGSEGAAAHPPQTNSSPVPVAESPSADSTKKAKTAERSWKQLLFEDLPLRDETVRFIFANCLDIFLTYILLRFGAMEANPIANTVMQIWGFNGMIAFKLIMVAFVCVIAQVVALKKPFSAKVLLNAGTVLVGMVVVYSFALFFINYRS